MTTDVNQYRMEKGNDSNDAVADMGQQSDCDADHNVFGMTQKNVRNIQDLPLIPVDCSFGIVREKKATILSLQNAIRKERKASGKHMQVTVVFAIRRPGCGACREHGQQLSYLLKEMKNVNAIGIVKETNVADDALLDFHNTYFKYPLYKDEKWILFKKFLGNRQVPVWDLLWKMNQMQKRFREKNIINVPFGGDSFTQGGVLIFDKDCIVRHVFYENTTELYSLSELRKAIEDAKLPLNSTPSKKLHSSTNKNNNNNNKNMKKKNNNPTQCVDESSSVWVDESSSLWDDETVIESEKST